MHDPEGSALARAAVVLLVISGIRWGMEAGAREAPEARADSTVLADHIAATEAAADEEDERSRRLDDDERIDPNTADEIQLDRLPGIGPATARAVVAARDTGARFLRPDDLLAVRGIGAATVEKIRPWLDLRSGRAPRSRRRVADAIGGRVAAPAGADRIDVNRADVEALERLPGIGPALAQRIVEERSIRSFASVDDLERVRGIGPATIARVRGRVTTGGNR